MKYFQQSNKEFFSSNKEKQEAAQKSKRLEVEARTPNKQKKFLVFGKFEMVTKSDDVFNCVTMDIDVNESHLASFETNIKQKEQMGL